MTAPFWPPSGDRRSARLLPPATGRGPHQRERVGVLLGVFMVRRWAVAANTSVTALVGGLATALAVVGVVGQVVADRWSPASLRPGGSPAEAVLLAVAVGVFFAAAGLGIFAGRCTSPGPELGFLRTQPVTPKAVGRAAALPLGVLVSGVLVAVGPITLRVTTAMTGRGLLHAAGLVGLLAAMGVAGGVAVLRGADRAFDRPGCSSLRLTVAFMVWTVALAVSLATPLPLLQWSGDLRGLLVLAPLGWPLSWWALIDPRPLVVAGAVAAATVMVVGAGRLQPTLPSGRSAAEVRTLRVGIRLPLVHVQIRRLVRHPSVLEALVVSCFFAAALPLGMGWMSSRTTLEVPAGVVAFLGAQVSTGFVALSRGMSDRHRPAEAFLGIGAATTVGSLAAAALALAVATALPALVIAAALLPVAAGAGWLTVLPLMVALAVAVSVVLTPALGGGSAEGGAVITYAAVSSVALFGLDRLDGPWALPAGVALTLAALGAATIVEQAHRRPS